MPSHAAVILAFSLTLKVYTHIASILVQSRTYRSNSVKSILLDKDGTTESQQYQRLLDTKAKVYRFLEA